MKKAKLTTMAVSLLFAGTLLAGNCSDCNEKGNAKKGCEGDRKGMFGGDRGKRGGGPRRMMENLNLTEEQKTQMKEIHEKYKEQMKGLGESVREAREALRTAAQAQDIDENTIRELSRTVADKMAEFAILRAKIKKESDSILTEEQKATIEKRKSEMESKREEMRKKCQKRIGKCKQRKCDEGVEDLPPPSPPQE